MYIDIYIHIYVYTYMIYNEEPGPGTLWADPFLPRASTTSWQLQISCDIFVSDVCGGAQGVPGVSPGRPWGVPGACPGGPRGPRRLQRLSGDPWDSFHKDNYIV